MSEEFDDECLMLNESLELANEEIEKLKKQKEIMLEYLEMIARTKYGDLALQCLKKVEGME
jgi:hypothetical protein